MSEKIAFEIHITVNGQISDNAEAFANICSEIGGKALLIELAKGENSQQLMLNKNLFQTNLKQTLDVAGKDCEKLLSRGFQPSRIKVEISSADADFFEKQKENYYFEWHGKIELKSPEILSKICRKHNAHLSRNALKGENKSRFITLREFGEKKPFEKRVDSLVSDLQKNGWEIIKQQSEFCVYDNNISLDKGWLNS